MVPTVTEFSECSGKARKDTGNYTVMCSYRAKDGGLHQGAWQFGEVSEGFQLKEPLSPYEKNKENLLDKKEGKVLQQEHQEQRPKNI